MNTGKILILALVSVLLCFVPSTTMAKIGVGVSAGKIIMEEGLKPGSSYELPPITVVNTGDEPSYYSAGVSYHESQERMKPQAEWFIFEPVEFYLEPENAQMVKIKLDLPSNAQPGDYFAYVEGRPINKTNGSTTIGIAAATKLYFTVDHASPIEALFYKLSSLYNKYSPWPQRVVATVLIVSGGVLVNKFFKIEITRKKERKSDGKE